MLITDPTAACRVLVRLSRFSKIGTKTAESTLMLERPIEPRPLHWNPELQGDQMGTKNQIVIIENNVYRLIALKHFIASEFRIEVRLSCANSAEEADRLLNGIKSANIILQTRNGFEDSIAILRRKKVNRLNSEIVLLATREGVWAITADQVTEYPPTSLNTDRVRLIA